MSESLLRMIRCMVNCNEAQLKRVGDNVKITGLPTDAALKVLAEKIHL